jgi:branched-chain amino acid transport system ATP-binding protein
MTDDSAAADRTPSSQDGLVVSGVSARYDRHAVVHGVDLEVRPGQFVSLLGANGAGKTTLLNSIAGLHPTWTGEIRLGDRDLRGLRGHQIAQSGVCYVPEGRGVLPDLTVMDNLRISIGKKKQVVDSFFEQFPQLVKCSRRPARTLSGGEQQMLAMAPAVIGSYQLLLVDELSLGLAPLVVEALFGVLEVIRKRGISILMVEQFAERALALSDTAYVMRKGYIVFHGPASSLRGQEEKLRELYMGSAKPEHAANGLGALSAGSSS